MENEKLIKVPESIYKDIDFLNKYHKEQFKNSESKDHFDIGQCVLIPQKKDRNDRGIIAGMKDSKIGEGVVYLVLQYSVYIHDYVMYYGGNQMLPIKKSEDLEKALENQIVRLTKMSIPDEDLQKFYTKHIKRLEILNDCIVTYIQESTLITKDNMSNLVYFCSRIIKFKNEPKKYIKTTLFSTLTHNQDEYIDQIREHLLLSNEEMQESIMEDIEGYRNDEIFDDKELDNIGSMLSDINMKFNIK